jgi:hypothetical protein
VVKRANCATSLTSVARDFIACDRSVSLTTTYKSRRGGFPIALLKSDFQGKENISMFRRLAALLCCATLLGVFPSLADEWNKKTIVTFNVPVELPGVALPAGTYVFKLMDSPSNRNIVQVFNADETRVLATILAIPNYRLEPAGETVLRFEERPSNTPEAIRAWFYPGNNFGQEFVYPKKQGSELAAKVDVPVLITTAPATAKPEELIAAPVTVAPPKPVAAPPIPEPAAPPPVAAAPAMTPAPPLEAAPAPEMPKTASPMPLIALLGACSIGLALLLRRFAKT